MRTARARTACALALALSATTVAGCRVIPPPRPDPSSVATINSLPPARLRHSRRPPAPPRANEIDASLVQRKCTGCHSMDRITRTDLDWRGWRGEVGQMVRNGAELTVPEQQAIVDYLAWRW